MTSLSNASATSARRSTDASNLLTTFRWAWRKPALAFGAAVALIAWTAAAATAEPITYTWTGNGSGNVNGTPYSDKDYTIVCLGNTDSIEPHSPDVVKNLCGCSMNIDGVGQASFANVGIFYSSAAAIVGFWKYNDLDYLSFADPRVVGWDLASPIGPVSGIVPGDPTQFVNVPTSLGSLTLSSTGPISFQATMPCPETPEPSCETTTDGSLSLKGDEADPTKAKLKWKWSKGTAELSDFGDPVTMNANSYLMCVYDDGEPVQELRIASAGTCGKKPCWSTNGSTTMKYRNRATNDDGVSAVKLMAGTGKAQLSVSAKGANTALPFPITDMSAVTIQFWNYGTGTASCWQTVLPAPAKTNNGSMDLEFQDRIP